MSDETRRGDSAAAGNEPPPYSETDRYFDDVEQPDTWYGEDTVSFMKEGSSGAYAPGVQPPSYSSDEVFQEQIYLDEPRRVDLTVARIDPWSALKIGFLVSIALGIATIVSAILLWFVLDGMNVFAAVEDFLIELKAERFLDLLDYVRLPRVVSYATILGVANVVIFTALSALVALLYNLISALVGGIRVSLMDE